MNAAAQAQRRRTDNFKKWWWVGLFVVPGVGFVCVVLLVGFQESLSDGLIGIIGGVLGGTLSSTLELIRTSKTQTPNRSLRVYAMNLVFAPLIGGFAAGLCFLFGFVTDNGQLKLPGMTLKAVNDSGFAGLGAAIGFSAQTVLANLAAGFSRRE